MPQSATDTCFPADRPRFPLLSTVLIVTEYCGLVAQLGRTNERNCVRKGSYGQEHSYGDGIPLEDI